MGVSNPALWQLAVERVGQLRDTPASAGLGGRMLDCMIAFHETVAGASAEAVVGRAHRGLAGNVLVEQPTAARPSSPVAACS
jgi:hypothetical protein